MKALRAVYGKTLARLGIEIPEIVVLDADLSKSTKTSDFAKAFPKRFHDMGIAEQDMLSTAAGMAVIWDGSRVVVGAITGELLR